MRKLRNRKLFFKQELESTIGSTLCDVYEISLLIFDWHREQECHFHNTTVIPGPWKNNKNSFGKKNPEECYLYYKLDRDM